MSTPQNVSSLRDFEVGSRVRSPHRSMDRSRWEGERSGKMTCKDGAAAVNDLVGIA